MWIAAMKGFAANSLYNRRNLALIKMKVFFVDSVNHSHHFSIDEAEFVI
jgi:hypothetical protein